jgi:hypothetical protein
MRAVEYFLLAPSARMAGKPASPAAAETAAAVTAAPDLRNLRLWIFIV